MRQEKHMQKGMRWALLVPMLRTALLAGVVCLACPAWTSADYHQDDGLGRHASTGVETTLLEVVTFVGGELAEATEPGQLLFEGHTDGHKPVLAPPYDVADDQRQQLTLDDFDNVSGTMQIQEVFEGTRVTFELTGLIPGGVYTLWADYYSAPGLTDDFAHGQALGALGAADGTENTLTAGADGSIT
ncbi:MAG: hypothetical protein IH892_08315, partial [Planctomycetes bacterium]|nr:hypothetical protein [Planctomycetota bacterium]